MTPFHIGVLGLQGDFEAHVAFLRDRVGVEARIVRTADELRGVAGLVIPGGESTTIGKLLDRFGLDAVIRERSAAGMPIYGTCAGMILLASTIEGSDQHRLALMDITVARNAFGRQIDSFEADITMPVLGEDPVRGVFIRAPYIVSMGSACRALAQFEGRTVAAQQGSILATAFHPELTADTRVHEHFVRMCRESIGAH